MKFWFGFCSVTCNVLYLIFLVMIFCEIWVWIWWSDMGFETLLNMGSLYLVGVCKKPRNKKKPLQTDRTDAKISIQFQFGSVSILLYKKLKISVRFSVANFNTPNRPNRTEIYYYIIFYIKYIIFCKYLTLTLWDTLWLF